MGFSIKYLESWSTLDYDFILLEIIESNFKSNESLKAPLTDRGVPTCLRGLEEGNHGWEGWDSYDDCKTTIQQASARCNIWDTSNPIPIPKQNKHRSGGISMTNLKLQVLENLESKERDCNNQLTSWKSQKHHQWHL